MQQGPYSIVKKRKDSSPIKIASNNESIFKKGVECLGLLLHQHHKLLLHHGKLLSLLHLMQHLNLHCFHFLLVSNLGLLKLAGYL